MTSRQRVLRSLAVAAVMTVMLWGRFLLPGRTLAPDGQIQTIAGNCRVAGPDLSCAQSLSFNQTLDSAAPSLTEVPASYYFRMAREAGWGHPNWSPFTGSGYPIALDGHNAITSPTRWFLSHFPGDESRDIVIVGRFFLWTFGITLGLALLDVGWVALIAGAFAAATAQYATARVDHVMLDVDLLAPWFPVLLLAYVGNHLSLRTSVALALGLGVLVSSLGFPESQVAFCFVVGVFSIAAVPATRSRSLLLGAATAAGFAALAPTWIPLLHNLDEFATSRDFNCFAPLGAGVREVWTQLVDVRLGHSLTFLATLAGFVFIPFAPRSVRAVTVALAVLFVWLIIGLPEAACRIPIVAAMRFHRHLQPHVQAIFLITAGAGADALSKRLRFHRAWLLAAAPVALGAMVIIQYRSVFARLFAVPVYGIAVVQSNTLAAVVVIAIACAGAWWVARRPLTSSLALPAILNLSFLALMLIGGLSIGLSAVAVVSHLPGSVSVPPLPREISTTSAIGAARQLSVGEDRRHYSPVGYVFPNWGEAIGMLEMLSLQALYPRAYHELNSTLFTGWELYPDHGIVPDRFQVVPRPLAMSREFQRVLVVNRVSLLTFRIDDAFFGEPGSPYERSACRLLTRTPAQRAESWVCPSVGGVGFFPSVLSVAAGRAVALSELAAMTPAALANAVVLGPEIDLHIGEETVSEPQAGEGHVLQIDRRGDDLAYVLDVRRPGIFVIADTYFPGWAATVNGKPAGISRANVAFKAVRVPAGRVDLRLHFSLR